MGVGDRINYSTKYLTDQTSKIKKKNNFTFNDAECILEKIKYTTRGVKFLGRILAFRMNLVSLFF
jgi:hypothetical protein